MTANATLPAGNPKKSLPCTCFKLRSLTRRVTQLYDHALAPSGLKVTPYSLIALALRARRSGAPTVSDQAQSLFTDRTTLTRNLRPLLVAGYVEVGAGTDARSKSVHVTAAGEAAFRAARPLWRSAQARMQSLGGAAALEALHVLVDDLLPHVGAPASADAASAVT